MPGLACSNAATASSVSFSRESLPQVLIRSATVPSESESDSFPTVPGAHAVGMRRHTSMRRAARNRDWRGVMVWAFLGNGEGG